MPVRPKASESVALKIRDRFGPEAYRDFYLAILAGHCPILVVADDGSYEVQHEKGGYTPTLEQRVQAAERLMNRGYGMPAQTHVINQEVSVQIAALTGTVDLNKLEPGQLAGLLTNLKQTLTLVPPKDPEDSDDDSDDSDDSDVLDAELVTPDDPDESSDE